MSTGFFDFFVLIFRVRDGGSDDESIAWRCRHGDENLPKFTGNPKFLGVYGFQHTFLGD